MNKEFLKLPKPRKGLKSMIVALKPGQCLRLTTAREAYALAGVRGQMIKEGHGVRSQVDGDDVLVWLVKKPEITYGSRTQP